MRMLNKSIALILVSTITLVMLSALSPTQTQAQVVEKGPPLDKIIIEVRMTTEVGIADVAAGKLDMFLWDASPATYEKLPAEMRESLKLIPSRTGYRDIVYSPVYSEGLPSGVMNSTLTSVTHFNPFAITKVRYATNWLYDRKFIVEDIMKGGGAPMFSAIQPAQVGAHKRVEHVYTELGMLDTGDETKALTMIDDALTAVVPELQAAGYDLYKKTTAGAPAGYWWTFKRPDLTEETVELKFFMRTEDERLLIGEYVADQIEKAGIKIDRRARDRTVCTPAIYYTDPLDWEDAAQVYTEGWVSMSEWPYREGGVAQMYAEWYYKFMPGQVGWQWVNETMNDLTEKLVLGEVADEEDYWNKMALAVKGGVQESVRVFLCEGWEYFAVNLRVTNIAYGMVSGLWPAWPLRAAATPDKELRAAEYSAEGALFMSAWNPVGGFKDVYSELMYRYLRDYGAYPHPMTGEPIPVRTTWDVDIRNMTVPSTALNYSAYTDSWYQVGTGLNASVKVVYNYMFSNWHHGVPMDMSDVLYSIAWANEWATLDYPGDPYYHETYADETGPLLRKIKGYEIINSTALAVYGDYVHPISASVTADYYIFWPSHPWEERAAWDYVIVNGGPVSGETYSWDGIPGTEWLDMIAAKSVGDITEAVKILGNLTVAPLFIPKEADAANFTGYAPTEEQAKLRYLATVDWSTRHGHLCISNGPYYMELYDAERLYTEFRAFRDPTYPFTSDYWQKKLFLERMNIEKIEAPTSVYLGDDISIDVYPIYTREYPEPVTKPADKGYVDVTLKDPTGTAVYSGAASLVDPEKGEFSITTPGDITANLTEGAYTIEATAAVLKGVYPDVAIRDIVLAAPPPPTYDLTLSVYPAEGGTTDPTTGVHVIAEGTDVTVTITIEEGYELDYWELDGAEWTAAGKNTTVTVTMDKLHSLRAYVKAIPPWLPTELAFGIVAIVIAVVAIGVAVVLWRRKPT